MAIQILHHERDHSDISINFTSMRYASSSIVRASSKKWIHIQF
ncbi:MAG: hypothetical protein ACLPWD_02975 [Methanobacterium sp.]